jgi:hypothetical protein
VSQSHISNCASVVLYLVGDLARVETLKGDESDNEDDEELGDEGDDSAARAGKNISRVRNPKERLLQTSIVVALKPLWELLESDLQLLMWMVTCAMAPKR